LMVGTTDNVVQTNSGTGNGGIVLRNNNYVAVASDGSAALELNRLASDGEIANFRKDGTTVGSISTNAGAFVVKGASTSQPVQLQTHDGNEDIEVDPDGFIKMETAGVERLRIDASGNLLVSKTSNDNSTAGVVLRDTGEGSFVVSGGRSGLFNRLSSDGEIVSFRKDNTTVGSINTNAGAFVVKGASASAPVQLQTHDGNEDIEVDPDGFIKMETAGVERLRIDSSGHVIAPYGVTLGTAVGTYAAANTLDDYEEGTWTPTVAGSTTAGTATYAVQNGKYTKIGRQVILQFEVGVNSWSVNPVGSIRIGGVPFTAASGQVSTGSIMASDLNFDVTNPVTAALYMAGGTEMQIYLTEDDAAWDQQSISAEAFSLISTITYYV